MNAQDFETLRDLCHATRELVNRLENVSRVMGTSWPVEQLRSDLQVMFLKVADLTKRVQDHEARSWRPDHAPRTTTSPRLSPRSPSPSPSARRVGVTMCPPGIASGAIDPTRFGR